MTIWFAIAAGGALGAIVRGSVYRVVERWSPAGAAGRFSDFGHARSTLIVNTMGSFGLGVIIAVLGQSSAPIGEAASAFWITGLCGALTTFSTFCADAIGFAKRGHRMTVAVILMANAALSIAAFLLGLAIMRF
jgi:CrcB protein